MVADVVSVPCLSICQPIYLSVCLYVCLSVTICICICICLYVCVSLYLSVCIASPCFNLSVWPSLLSLCLSVCLPIFLSNFFRGVTALSFFFLRCTKEGPTQSGIAVIGWARPSLFPFKTPDFLPEFHQTSSFQSLICLLPFGFQLTVSKEKSKAPTGSDPLSEPSQ